MIIVKHAEARQAGTTHRLNGTVCQDAISFYESDDIVVTILCDGAGAIKHSERISETIALKMCKYIADNFKTLYVIDDDKTKKALINSTLSFVPDAYCTFLCAAISKRDRKSIIAHIGDGMIFAINDSETAEVVSFPENGEEPNLTFFLNSTDPAKHLRIIKNNNDNHIMYLLCSDGVSPSLYDPTSKKCAKAIKIFNDWVWKYPEQVSNMLNQELDQLFRQRSEDDMSISIISFRHE